VTDAPTFAQADLRTTLAEAIRLLKAAKREAARDDEVRAYLIDAALRITEHALTRTSDRE
jgi:hypothetical protein